MAVAFFYNNEIKEQYSNRVLLWHGTHEDLEIFDEEKIIKRRPKLNDLVLGEYYPAVFVCIDGKDYLVSKSKIIEKFGDYHD